MVTNSAINTTNPISVNSGGSGVASTVAYTPLCGGTTTTAPLQSVASVGTSGQVLTSNGAAALPSFQDVGGAGGNIKMMCSFTVVNANQSITPITSYNVNSITSSSNGGITGLRYTIDMTNAGLSDANYCLITTPQYFGNPTATSSSIVVSTRGQTSIVIDVNGGSYALPQIVNVLVLKN